ncbi:MAG: CdaR family protein [Marinisporobacter sp.]|jgi:YbbR domain-containing protein|nr:CdaR family protein [Marinisporobacter sp.]
MNNIWRKIKLNIENSRFFSRNTTPKIISIIFAMMLWLYVMGEVNPQSVIELNNVDVGLLNVEDVQQSGLVVMGQKDFTVNVKISGRRNELYKISPKDILVRADLRGFNEGVNSVPVEVSTPPNVELVDISPKQIKITLDEIVKMQKNVEVKVTSKPTEGFEVGKSLISPEKVMVEGPESLVNTVTKIVAEVNVSDLQEDIIERLPLKAVNRDGKEVSGVEVKNKYADVTLPILRTKEVPIDISYEGEAKKGFKITNITLREDTVTIVGKKEIIENIQKIQAKTVNLSGLDQTLRKDISLILPEGVSIRDMAKDPTVLIRVEAIKTKEIFFKKEEVNIKDLKEDYMVDLSRMPDNIKVEITAIESELSTINKENINLYINGSDLSEGLYYVRLSYDIAKEVEGSRVAPEEVDLIIKKREKEPSTPTNTEKESDESDELNESEEKEQPEELPI